MTSLPAIVGYIVASLVIGYVSRNYLGPRVKLRYWHHPSPSFYIQESGSVFGAGRIAIKNSGRKHAEEVHIRLSNRPYDLTVYPDIPYSTETSEADEHVIAFDTLGSGEEVTIDYLGFEGAPHVTHVRSKSGPAQSTPVEIRRSYPDWVGWVVIVPWLVGVATLIYLASAFLPDFRRFLGL